MAICRALQEILKYCVLVVVKHVALSVLIQMAITQLYDLLRESSSLHKSVYKSDAGIIIYNLLDNSKWVIPQNQRCCGPCGSDICLVSEDLVVKSRQLIFGSLFPIPYTLYYNIKSAAINTFSDSGVYRIRERGRTPHRTYHIIER